MSSNPTTKATFAKNGKKEKGEGERKMTTKGTKMQHAFLPLSTHRAPPSKTEMSSFLFPVQASGGTSKKRALSSLLGYHFAV